MAPGLWRPPRLFLEHWPAVPLLAWSRASAALGCSGSSVAGAEQGFLPRPESPARLFADTQQWLISLEGGKS